MCAAARSNAASSIPFPSFSLNYFSGWGTGEERRGKTTRVGSSESERGPAHGR